MLLLLLPGHQQQNEESARQGSGTIDLAYSSCPLVIQLTVMLLPFETAQLHQQNGVCSLISLHAGFL